MLAGTSDHDLDEARASLVDQAGRVRALRIAFLTSSLVLAGSERQMVALATRLPRDRFQVDFLARSGAGPLDDTARAAGSAVHYLHPGPTPTSRLDHRLVAAARRTKRYVGVVRRNRYDIVDAWLYPSDVLAGFSRGITRTPVILSGQRNVDPHRAFGPLSRRIDRIANRTFDGVVAVCNAAAEYAISVNGASQEKVQVIRNGVELPAE